MCHRVIMSSFVSLCVCAPGFSPSGDLHTDNHVFLPPGTLSVVALSHRPQQIDHLAASLPLPASPSLPSAIHHEVRRQIKNVVEGESGM
jgi:hypothetical protein